MGLGLEGAEVEWATFDGGMGHGRRARVPPVTDGRAGGRVRT